MIEIRDTTLQGLETPETLQPEQTSQLIESLVRHLYNGGVISIPFASHEFYSWIAIWDIVVESSTIKFTEAMTNTKHEEYEQKLTELTKHIHEMDSTMEAQLMRISRNERQLWCLVVRFDGPASSREFISETLPSVRRRYSQAWAAFRHPYEIAIIYNEKQDHPTNA